VCLHRRGDPAAKTGRPAAADATIDLNDRPPAPLGLVAVLAGFGGFMDGGNGAARCGVPSPGTVVVSGTARR